MSNLYCIFDCQSQLMTANAWSGVWAHARTHVGLSWPVAQLPAKPLSIDHFLLFSPAFLNLTAAPRRLALAALGDIYTARVLGNTTRH